MAVPIVTVIDPAIGPSMGGNMIEFTGANFSLPVPAPPVGPGPTPSTPSVTVTIGGIPSIVFVVESTRMFVRAPRFSLVDAEDKAIVSQPVDIVITNLDALGVPIVGETLTIVGGYTYARIDLSSENESDLSRLVRTFIGRWKSQVIPAITLDTNSDFADVLASLGQAEATLPGVTLIGPEFVSNRLQRPASNAEDLPLGNPDEFFTKRYCDVEDLLFDVLGYSDNEGEFLNLLAVAREFVDRNVDISMPADPSAPNADLLTYEMEYTAGGRIQVQAQSGTTQNSNLHVFRGQMKIVGFAATGLAGVKRDRALAVTAKVGATGEVLQVSGFAGNTSFTDLAQSRRSPPPGGSC